MHICKYVYIRSRFTIMAVKLQLMPFCMSHCLFHFCPTLLAPLLYFPENPTAVHCLSQVNHQITAQISCLCTIGVPHFWYIYRRSSNCYRGSYKFYIFATIHSQTVLYTALYTSESHSLQLLYQTFQLPGGQTL
jgi:hypothetical protein